MRNLQGVYTAIVTPFDEKEELDEDGLTKNLLYQMNAGVDGIVALGTTGESPTLENNERIKLIKQTVKTVDGKIPVVIGCGTNATKTTIEMTCQAEHLGADAALIVTPYYNKPTKEGIYRHFKAVAKNSSLPIIVYNIQGRTGQNISTDTLKCLAEIPSIIGVKDSSGNLIQMMEVIEEISAFRPGFALMCGDDPLTLPALSVGAKGVISVISNLVPELVKKLIVSFENEDIEEAKSIHYKLLPLIRAAFLETNPIPIKTMMTLLNMPAGPCRLPLCEPAAENFLKIQTLLQNFTDISHGQKKLMSCEAECRILISRNQ